MLNIKQNSTAPLKKNLMAPRLWTTAIEDNKYRGHRKKYLTFKKNSDTEYT